MSKTKEKRMNSFGLLFLTASIIILIGIGASCSNSGTNPDDNNPPDTATTAINIYWSHPGLTDRGDSAWVPKDSCIQFIAKNQRGNPVNDVTWHSSDPSIASINSSGLCRGLKDWFNCGNTQPEITVWASLDTLQSNNVVVQTVVNLTGTWAEYPYGDICDVTMACDVWSPSWRAGPLLPIGGFDIFGDSLHWESSGASNRWSIGHILNTGRRVEFIWYWPPDEYFFVYIKNGS